MEILCDSNHFLTVKIRPIAFLPQYGFSRLRHDTETPFVSQEEVIWNQRLLNKSIARKRQNLRNHGVPVNHTKVICDEKLYVFLVTGMIA